jgi:hypothetical protein
VSVPLESTTRLGGWPRRARRASDRGHEDAPRQHHARRPAPHDAVAVALLPALSASRSAGVRGRCHLLGPSSDVLRERGRCTRCGHKGATIQHPGWGGADIGFLPFPVR